MDPKLFLPGDCLLYAPKGFFGWIISIKTWHKVAHTEVYIGEGKSVASRDGEGVEIYPVRTERLTAVLRPNLNFNLNKALQWFHEKAEGQKYDFLGLLRFAWRSKVVPDSKDNKQFCSELATRFYRAGDFDPFNAEDADAVAPFMFLYSPVFKKMWGEV